MDPKCLLSQSCSCLLLVIMIHGASSAPQNPSSISNPLYQEILNLINLSGPYVNKNPGVNEVTLDLTKEFFKHEDFVRELVDCFDLFHQCKYPGMTLLIDTLGETFVPGEACSRCPPEFNKIVTYSQNQFQTTYRSILKKFLANIADFFGTL